MHGRRGGSADPTHPAGGFRASGFLGVFEAAGGLVAPAAALIGTAIVLVGLLALLLVGRDNVPSTSADAPGVVTSGLPPRGQVWFGSDFDPRTFTLLARTEGVRTGSTVAAVARLTAPITTGRALVGVELDGSRLATHEIVVGGAGDQDVVGWTFALPVAGTYRIIVTRQDGTVLAGGVVDAR